MFNKLLYIVVVLGSVVAAIAAVSLAGCEPDKGVALQADPTPAEAKLQVVAGTPVCLDGWEVFMLPGGSALYRHAHDVNEHLISCQGD